MVQIQTHIYISSCANQDQYNLSHVHVCTTYTYKHITIGKLNTYTNALPFTHVTHLPLRETVSVLPHIQMEEIWTNMQAPSQHQPSIEFIHHYKQIHNYTNSNFANQDQYKLSHVHVCTTSTHKHIKVGKLNKYALIHTHVHLR